MERNIKRVVLNRARGMILFSVLNSVTQTVLQAMMIRESRKTYDDFQEVCPGQQLVPSDFVSRIARENIVLMLLHFFAMIMHIFALMRSSAVFDLFLFTLFGLSAGCGFTQYFRDILHCEAPCNCSERNTLEGLEIARLVLAVIFLVFVGYTMFLRSTDYNPRETPYKASIPTVLFLGFGLVILAVGGNFNTLSWPFFYLWIVFAAFTLFISIVLPVLRHHLLKVREDNPPASKATDHPETSLTFEIDIPTLSQTPPSLAQTNSFPIHDTACSPSSEPDHVADLFPVLSSESIFTEKSRSSWYSVGAETFHSGIHPHWPIQNVSIDQPPWVPEVGQPSRVMRDSLRTISSMGTAFTAENGLQPSLTDNRHTSLPPNEDPDEDVHVTPATPRRSISMQAMETPDHDGENQPMTESYPSPSVSPILPSRSPSVSTSTLSVPLYTDGPYSYRPRRDTLSSDGTCDTLPSYHSRQSHMVPDSVAELPTLPNIRSLPALPPSY